MLSEALLDFPVLHRKPPPNMRETSTTYTIPIAKSTHFTLAEPRRIEQEPFLCGTGTGNESEQILEEGQSPQEQPNTVSPHENTDTFIGSMEEDGGTVDMKSIEYGDPG